MLSIVACPAPAREDKEACQHYGKLKQGLGILCLHLGQYDQAQAAFQACIAYAQAIENDDLYMRCIESLGSSALAHNDFSNAQSHFRQALAYRLEQDPESRAVALDYHGLGVAIAKQASVEHALPYFEHALIIYQKIGDERGIGLIEHSVGDCARQGMDIARAYHYFHKAHQRFQKLQDAAHEAMMLYSLAQLALLQENYGKAKVQSQQSYNIAKKYGKIRYQSCAVICLAAAESGLGNSAAASASFREALGLCRQLDAKEERLHLLEHLANHMHHHQARPAIAAQLMGARDMLKTHYGMTITTALEQWQSQELRKAFPHKSRFDASFAAGQRMTLEALEPWLDSLLTPVPVPDISVEQGAPAYKCA